MTIPSTGDLNMWDGALINNTDWDANWTQLVTYLTNANYDVTFNSVTASSFVGLPIDSFSLTTGENVTAGDCIRVNGGLAYKATSANEAGITSVVGIAEATVSSGNPVNVLYDFREGFSALTVGGLYYVGAAGAITASKPSWGMEIGTAVSASRININIKAASYTSVIDKISFYANQTSFNTTVQQDMSITVWNVYSATFPTIWATQPIIDGSHKVYLRFEISGGANLGDGFRLYITEDDNSTLFDTGDQIINNLSRSAIYYWDIANLGTTTLNIGSNPLNGITADSTDASARWKIRAKRTVGSSTSGNYYIRSIEFVLVQQ